MAAMKEHVSSGIKSIDSFEDDFNMYVKSKFVSDYNQWPDILTDRYGKTLESLNVLSKLLSDFIASNEELNY